MAWGSLASGAQRFCSRCTLQWGLLKGKRTDEGEVSLRCEGRAGSISGWCPRPGHSHHLEPFWLLLVPSELLTEDLSAQLSGS